MLNLDRNLYKLRISRKFREFGYDVSLIDKDPNDNY